MLLGYATNEISKYTEKLQVCGVHKRVYLKTNNLGLLGKPCEEEFILDKSLEHLFLMHDPFRH